ncbi:MAG: molybdopterin-dependent oxidoreductase [Dehalococcoidia bacterium]
MAKVYINGAEVDCPDNAPLVEVIKNAGTWISNLCYIDGLPPYAGCRSCLVEIEGARGLQLSCTTPVREGMVVRTNSEEVAEARRMVISLINANHPDRCLSCHRRIKCKPGDICLRDDVVTHRCLTCSKNYRCELQTTNELAEMQQYEPFTGEERSYYGRPYQPPRDVYNPYLEFDPQMCILCTRCVRACDDLHNTQAITLAGKGWQTRIAFGAATSERDGYVHESNCDFCGTCIDVCPTAALMEHPNKWVANTSSWTNTACNYCAVGCSLRMGTKNGKTVIVKPDVAGNDFSRDQICVRGRFHYDAISDADRLGRPIRRRGEVITNTTWDSALDHVAERLAATIAASGPESVAFLGSPYATTEENYLLGRLAREIVGSDALDSSAGPVASAVAAALNDALGTEALPNNMEDFRGATTIVVCAQDIEQTHPVASSRLKDGVARAGAHLVYISPRYGELCDFAHVWLQPPPGLEAATVLALAQAVTRSTAPPEPAEAEQPDAAEPAVEETAVPPAASAEPPAVETATPVGEESASSADIDIRTVKAISPGVGGTAAPGFTLGPDWAPTASSGALSAASLDGYDALLAEEGPELPAGLAEAIKDAAGLLVRGRERTAQGPMAFVLAPPEVDALSAGAQTRALVDLALVTAGPGDGPLWTHILPHQPNVNGMRDAGVRGEGRDFTAILEAARSGEIKALVCLRDNPLFLAPDTSFVREALQKLDFLVVVDELLSDTAKLAAVVLPDVSVWGKDGTIVSADRRLMRQEAAVAPVDEARPAWLILTQLAARLGDRLGKDTSGWHYHNAAAVMDDLAKDPISEGRFGEDSACENSNGLRQPAQHPPKVSLVPVGSPAVKTLSRSGDQFTLLTHRGQFTSFEAAALRKPDADRLHREEHALIHRFDAGRLAAADYDVARISSERGAFTIPLRVSDDVAPGTVFVPIFYQGGMVMGVLSHEPSELVAPAVRLELTGERSAPPADPVASRQPEASGQEIIPLERILSATASGRLPS